MKVRRNNLLRGALAAIAAGLAFAVLGWIGGDWLSSTDDWLPSPIDWLADRVGDLVYGPLIGRTGGYYSSGMIGIMERIPLLMAVTYGLRAALAATIALVLFCLVSRRAKAATDGHTRCGACGQILEGLTEPRCPECGLRI